jgi:hypothetical protein
MSRARASQAAEGTHQGISRSVESRWRSTLLRGALQVGEGGRGGQ